ncbi:TIGR01777 family oxidoreductase [Aliiglaciecola sp. CAU 1673]|uniref:TIGR01777 family oxidoreductase n=1 Tax=Aliiglaciecola sp. CAU 1673 TaxID=3032595 RepID=UPI0023D9C186|nr:TIGR01777 family oxidoreductase [Aliiglaciecola sp. CAU 1673]MDF2178824.1 TIGR01777 family oxidoreductase [Aliiglaciecola sp. CAU 1673]
MRIFMTGGTGLIGTKLLTRFPENHRVTVLTRNLAEAEMAMGRRAHWISSLKGLENLNGFDAVINLAGEPIADKRWTAAQKQEICESRWNITQRLVDLIQASEQPPKVFLSGSAIGYYGRQGEDFITEYHERCHNEFSHSLCAKWEDIAMRASSDKTRVCTLRTGIVLSRKGGALQKMIPPFKLGLGGPIGDGQQYMSWIHINDMVSAISFLLDNPETQGPYNLTAPNPVTNNEFSQTLAKTLHRPCIFRVPAAAMKLMLGELSDLLLYGQRVLPKRLEDAGFHFQFQQLPDALHNLLRE